MVFPLMGVSHVTSPDRNNIKREDENVVVVVVVVAGGRNDEG